MQTKLRLKRRQVPPFVRIYKVRMCAVSGNHLLFVVKHFAMPRLGLAVLGRLDGHRCHRSGLVHLGTQGKAAAVMSIQWNQKPYTKRPTKCYPTFDNKLIRLTTIPTLLCVYLLLRLAKKRSIVVAFK